MRVQNGTFAMMSNNYTHAHKETKSPNNAHASKANKIGSQNATNVSLSPASQFDKAIENIQEQIQKIHENDKYDADTKKSKIEELEKQLKEIEKAKASQLSDSVSSKKEQSEKNNANENINNNAKGKSNDSGVVLELSFNAKALIEADNSMKNLRNAHSTKVKLEGSSNVLASEIKIDKGRGVDTSKKEEELDKLKEGVDKSLENIGNAINDINNAAQEISEGATPPIETSGEGHNNENIKSKETADNAPDNPQTETAAQEKTSVENKKDETNIKNQ